LGLKFGVLSFFFKGALFNERYNNDSTIFTMLYNCDESWWQQKAWLIRGCHRIKKTVIWRWCCVGVGCRAEYDEKEEGGKNLK
jgi:hypothetical protein